MPKTASKTRWHDVIEAGRGEQLVRQARYGAQRAEAAPLPEGLHPAVRESLSRAGIDGLYSHQAEAFEVAMGGPVIVTTGTASGKSLCFHLPVLDTLAGSPGATALYLYPTKALARDQEASVRALLSEAGLPIPAIVYRRPSPRRRPTRSACSGRSRRPGCPRWR